MPCKFEIGDTVEPHPHFNGTFPGGVVTRIVNVGFYGEFEGGRTKWAVELDSDQIPRFEFAYTLVCRASPLNRQVREYISKELGR